MEKNKGINETDSGGLREADPGGVWYAEFKIMPITDRKYRGNESSKVIAFPYEDSVVVYCIYLTKPDQI